MTTREPIIQEPLKKDQISFQVIPSGDELVALFAKYHAQDKTRMKEAVS